MKITRRLRLFAVLAAAIAALSFGVGAAAMAAGGANSGCGPYCPNGVGDPAGNGYGNGNPQPSAGTEGNADSKFPPGQSPDGTDNNNGYECDGNGGVGQTNPAHTGCGPSSAPSPSSGG